MGEEVMYFIKVILFWYRIKSQEIIDHLASFPSIREEIS